MAAGLACTRSARWARRGHTTSGRGEKGQRASIKPPRLPPKHARPRFSSRVEQSFGHGPRTTAPARAASERLGGIGAVTARTRNSGQRYMGSMDALRAPMRASLARALAACLI